MQDEQDRSRIDATQAPSDLPQGVKVYERPARRPIPAWVFVLLLLILLMLTWFAFQFIR